MKQRLPEMSVNHRDCSFDFLLKQDTLLEELGHFNKNPGNCKSQNTFGLSTFSC